MSFCVSVTAYNGNTDTSLKNFEVYEKVIGVMYRAGS